MRSFSLAAAAFGAVLASAPAARAQIPPIWQSWIAGLPAQGYTVVQGGATEVANTSVRPGAANGGLGSGEPPYAYIEPYVPIENEYVDPYYAAPLTVTTPAGVG